LQRYILASACAIPKYCDFSEADFRFQKKVVYFKKNIFFRASYICHVRFKSDNNPYGIEKVNSQVKTKSNLIPIKSDNNTKCKNVLLGKVAHFFCMMRRECTRLSCKQQLS